MQERPNKLVLLTAISRFLIEDVRPQLTDARLNFRALIAAHLASVVASELTSDEDFLARELARLAPLLPDAPPPGPSLDAQRAALSDQSARLAKLLREGDPSEADLAKIAEALHASLREKLAVENPRFDTSLDIE
jgi:hypothetical protein